MAPSPSPGPPPQCAHAHSANCAPTPTGGGNGGGGSGIPGLHFLGDLFGAATDPFGYALGKIEGWLVKGFVSLLGDIATSWLDMKGPDLTTKGGPVDRLQGATGYLVAAVAVGAVLLAAGRIALQRRGQAAAELTRNLVVMVMLSAAGVPALVLLIGLGDDYTEWIMNSATGGEGIRRLDKLAEMFVDTPGGVGSGEIGVSMVILLVVVLAFGLLQMVLFAARSVGIVLLVGLLPLAGAAGVAGGSGQALRQRYLTWLATCVLYKPAAATIYAGVFWIWNSPEKMDLTLFLEGVVGLCMAVFALPALVKLLAPAISFGTAAWSGDDTHTPIIAVAKGAKAIRPSGGGRGRGRPDGTPPPTYDLKLHKGFKRANATEAKATGASAKAASGTAKASAGSTAAGGVAVGGVIAAAVLLAAAPTIAAKRIGRTGAAGIGEEDY